jgi:hypothetical protein
LLAAGNTPTDQTGFPAAKNRSNFGSLRAQKLRGIKGRWVDLIESLQPYHSPKLHDNIFFILDHNNNIAKHRAIHLAIVSMKTSKERPLGFNMSHPEMPGRQFYFDNLLDGPIEAGKDLFRITVDPPIRDLAVTPAMPPARIKFEDRLTHATDFDYTNRDLIQWGANTVAKFQPAFD